MTYQEFLEEWESPATEIRCHTSGSTGTPACILLPKEQMRASARRTIEFFGLTSQSVLYSCISPDFIGGKMMLVRQQELGCVLESEQPSNRPLSSGCDVAVIDLLSVVPSQMIHLIDNIDSLPDIRNILVGGSAIPSELRERIAASGLNAYETYGMTETASHVAIRKIEAGLSPFHTLPGITVEDVNGALRIDIDGWQSILTNDACVVLNPHEFEILGRLDNAIVSGGKKIHPEMVEQKLSSFLHFPFYITSQPDEKWGEAVVMMAEADCGLRRDIENFCRENLESHERPKRIVFLERLPRTPNGKILRVHPQALSNIPSKE